MKLALLLPGYLESPDYQHLKVIGDKLSSLGYTVLRIDPCLLWSTGDVKNYTLTNYIKQVQEVIESYKKDSPVEIVLIGHSLGASAAILVGVNNPSVTKVVCLSPTVVLDKSREKWGEDGIRRTRKDLPSNPSEFREFAIPLSHFEDKKNYVIVESLNDFKKPLMFLFGLEDPSAKEIQKVIDEDKISYVIRIENMSHDFRQSRELCNQVAEEVERFLLV